MSFQCGLVVRIPGFHPGGPGSIPGMGTKVLVFYSGRDMMCFRYGMQSHPNIMGDFAESKCLRHTVLMIRPNKRARAGMCMPGAKMKFQIFY